MLITKRNQRVIIKMPGRQHSVRIREHHVELCIGGCQGKSDWVMRKVTVFEGSFCISSRNCPFGIERGLEGRT